MLSGGAMFAFLTKFLLVARSRLKSRARLEAEILVLRQQVIVLSRKSRSRVWLRNIDRLVFVRMYRQFPSILNAIRWSSPRPWSAGIGAAFAPIGCGSPAGGVAAPESTARSATSSDE